VSATVSIGARWAELVSTALLGTDRRGAPGLPAPSAGAELLAPFARAPDPAVSLLDQVSAAHAARRAGAPPVPVGRQLCPVVACPRVPCPTPAARRLGVVLAGRHADLLPELLGLLVHRGLAVPPEHLCALMDRTRAEPELRALVVQAAGPVLPWLADALPHLGWSSPSAFVDGGRASAAPGVAQRDELWSHGSITDRVAVLRHLHTVEPATARAWLVQTFGSERAEHRAVLLGALGEGLGPDDEPLLERSLDDRSAVVRATAVGLLRRLDRSQWTDRMTARARAMVHIEPGVGEGVDRLGISLVAPLPAAWERDGIDAAAPRGVSIGVHALRQVVAATPLAAWTALAAPVTLVAMASAHELGPVLVAAWADAAAAQRDARWARLLLEEAEIPALAAALDDEDLSAAAARVAFPEQLLTPFGLAVLAAAPRPWPEELAHAVTAAVVGAFIERRVGRHSAPVLRRLGRLLPAELLEPIAEELSVLGLPPPLDGVRDELCDLLVFRAAMVRELAPAEAT
jgi:hypothetical protein